MVHGQEWPFLAQFWWFTPENDDFWWFTAENVDFWSVGWAGLDGDRLDRDRLDLDLDRDREA